MTETKHNFFGQEEARPVLALLNSKSPARRKVEELLRLIETISRPSTREPVKLQEDARNREGFNVRLEAKGKTTRGHLAVPGAMGRVNLRDKATGRTISVLHVDPARQEEHCKTLMQVNRMLERYKTWPQLQNQLDDRWQVSWNSKYPQAHAMRAVIDLAQMGMLDRVRRCEPCGRWFFARFRHARFCSLDCQQRKFRSSEQWKAHRREYMRRKYHEKKRRSRR